MSLTMKEAEVKPRGTFLCSSDRPMLVPTESLEQGWANFLTRGPHSVLKYDRGAGPGAFGHAM